MGLSTFLRDRPPTRGMMFLSLNEVGRILIRSSVADGGGGFTDSYSPAGTASWDTTTNVRCRIDPISGGRGGEAETADRISDRSTSKITLPHGTEISVDDDFQIKDLGQFEVTAVRTRTNEIAHVIEVTDRT